MRIQLTTHERKNVFISQLAPIVYTRSTPARNMRFSRCVSVLASMLNHIEMLSIDTLATSWGAGIMSTCEDCERWHSDSFITSNLYCLRRGARDRSPEVLSVVWEMVHLQLVWRHDKLSGIKPACLSNSLMATCVLVISPASEMCLLSIPPSCPDSAESPYGNTFDESP
jgi:hypothetical protein